MEQNTQTTYQRNNFKENTSNSSKNDLWNKKHKQLIKEMILRKTQAIHQKMIYGTKQTNNYLSTQVFKTKNNQFIMEKRKVWIIFSLILFQFFLRFLEKTIYDKDI